MGRYWGGGSCLGAVIIGCVVCGIQMGWGCVVSGLVYLTSSTIVVFMTDIYLAISLFYTQRG